MNLWVKRVGQLAISAVALFFFSCQEETTFLGYPNPSPKYEFTYIDIPIKSSTLLYDSIRTTNFYATNDLNRLLVGHHEDPVFGTLTASAYTQFVTAAGLKTYPVPTEKEDYQLVLDSVTMILRLDFYAYGTDGETTQKIKIFEITDPLAYSNTTSVSNNVGGQQTPTSTTYYQQQEYFTFSETAYDATPLGVGTFKMDMENANQGGKVDYVYMRLNSEFANRLFNTAKTKDSLTSYRKFTSKFPGLVIAPDLTQSDKIVGITASDDSTIVRLHYHSINVKDANKVKDDSLILDFSLSRQFDFISYNKIETDRSGTDLNGLTEFYEEDESGEKRYIQAGAGIVTKIDFAAFIDSLKDIPRLAINKAELVIDNLDEDGHYIPPSNLIVKLIKENNRPMKFTYPGRTASYAKDIAALQSYNGFVNFDNGNYFTIRSIPFDSTLNVINDAGGALTFTYSDEENNYKAPATLFFNQLHELSLDEEKTLYTKAVLIPHFSGSQTTYGSLVNGKTLNRVSFDKDNIRLRVYYTIPTINQNQ